MVADSDCHGGELVLSPLAGAAAGCLAGALLWRLSGSGSPWGLAGFAGLGWLHALCQQRTSWLGYALVGLSYAVTVWILTHLVSAVFGLASWPVARLPFALCLLYTELLALGALTASLLSRGNRSPALPKD